MDTYENFNRQNTIGKQGEAMVAAELIKEGKTVIDASTDAYYQGKDIDFIIGFQSGNTVTLEVKTDIKSQQTGNIFIETFCKCNESRNYQGWYYYCEADFLCFVQPDKGIAHIVARKELWQLCESGLYKQFASPFSKGYCIPIAALQALPKGKYKQLTIENNNSIWN